jgi:GntR family transcriptional regulator/MocR family aminotransferase
MYERHLRRLRRRNAARREELLQTIYRHLGERVEVTGDGSGAHIVLWPRKRVAEATVIALAASRRVRVYGISQFFLTRSSRTGLMLGYSRMNEKEIREGIRLLGEIL